MSRGLIQYVTPVEVASLSPYQMRGPYPAGVSPWQDMISVGQTQSVYLPWYKIYDRKLKEDSTLSMTPTAYGQGMFYGLTYIHFFEVQQIRKVRQAGIVNLYDIYEKLNEACARKVVLSFYPDADNFPDEFVRCMVKKISPPRRMQNVDEFYFRFELIEINAGQIPSVPAPVLV